MTLVVLVEKLLPWQREEELQYGFDRDGTEEVDFGARAGSAPEGCGLVSLQQLLYVGELLFWRYEDLAIWISVDLEV